MQLLRFDLSNIIDGLDPMCVRSVKIPKLSYESDDFLELKVGIIPFKKREE